ncbi:MAG: hypothetical protein MI919_33575, partial [Holophagales bacterium]|nr:hypothetical protein [Holophagales bacterium]
AAMATATASWAGEVQTFPPAPTLLPDMYAVEVVHDPQQGDVYRFTNPYIPPLSQSNVHRIGLIRKRSGTDPLVDHAVFHLLVPEKLTDELMLAGPGATILGDSPYVVPLASFHGPVQGADQRAHFGLCDPLEGEQQNPYPCNEDNDCYKMVVIKGVEFDDSSPQQIQLWATPITVEVDQPKTVNAKIIDVTPGTPVPGPRLGTGPVGIFTFHTPMIAGTDKRFLLARFASSSLSWKDNSGTTQTAGRYDAVYSYYQGGAECDVTKWTEFKPLAFAPEDHDLEDGSGGKRFGFTEYSFKTPSGTDINSDPAVDVLPDLGAKYVWLDHRANNLFFATLSRKLIDEDADCQNPPSSCQHLYEVECVPGTGCTDPYDPAAEKGSAAQGWMAMGLWTHGKMVLLDSLTNHCDFSFFAFERFHRNVDLFSTGDPVRVGTCAHPGPIKVGNDLSTEPYGWVRTPAQFGSQEHFFNMVPNMRPRTPRDVVWLITSGARSDEIAFDDYISFKTLIFSPMNALKEMSSDRTYYDGNDPANPEMRLQNAATTRRWQPPSYGKVVLPAASPETKGRIENVALGGIKGRGFYLHPETRIEYPIPAQPTTVPSMDGQVWMVSLFLDPTESVPWGELRTLLTFPGGAHIDLFASHELSVCPGPGTASCSRVTLPKSLASRGWTHLAFVLDPDTGKIRFFQDGFVFGELPLPMDLRLSTKSKAVTRPESH